MSNLIIKEVLLTQLIIEENMNKFYHLKLYDNDLVLGEYGRTKNEKVSSKIANKGFIGERGYTSFMNKKIREGYKISDIILENNINDKSNSNFNLLELAMSQIESNNIKCKELVQRLVNKNIHNITTSSNISFNKNTGLFSSALGPINKNGIIKAQLKLKSLSELIEKGNLDINNIELKKLNEDYFSIIPTYIKNLREIEKYFIYTKERLDKQFEICENLLKTLDLLTIVKVDNKDNKDLEVFKVKMNLLEDKKEIKRINNLFEKTKNNDHGKLVNSLVIENIYSISLNDEDKVFKKDMSNIMELFHGTKVVNILSILKSGLLMPKVTPGSKSGAMFGDGLYFSDQSTKSLNYCDGLYWNNSSKQDKIYLFIADVAMGNYEVPKHSTRSHPSKGYDSYFAKAGISSVRNNEMIVFNKNQIQLKYLLEIKMCN